MMKFSSGTFSAFDSVRLFYRYWEAEKGRPLFLIIHGHGEHSGRYEKFCSRLQPLNVNIAAFDLRGNGRSEGKPVYVNDFDDYLKDVDAYLSFLKDNFGTGDRLILFGHSLGGLIASYWSWNRQQALQALILSSPCFGLKLPGLIISLNRCLDRHFPNFYYAQPIYPPHLSHNSEEIAKYRQDPLIQRKMSPRLLKHMIDRSQALPQLFAAPVPFPVYMMASGMEKIVDLETAKKDFQRIQAPCKKMHVFDGLYHEIFNEIDQDQVFGVLQSYLREILDHSR